MISISTAFLLFVGITVVFGQYDPHKFYLDRNVCQILEKTSIDKYFIRVKLKCDWNKFVDASVESNPYVENKDSKVEYLYELEFVPSAVQSDNPKYFSISKNLFSIFRVKSMSFKNLGIRSVEADAFDKRCCHSTLEKLDLSNNQLVRLDAKTLANLNRLENLNVANNQLSFGERNFQNNKNLRIIDMSNNKLQYLPSHLFQNLNELEEINLNGNHFKSVHYCVFNDVQTSKLARQFYPATINLLNNPLDCDCDLFYLSRHLNYKLNLTCSEPDFYAGKSFSELKNEDPASRCNYGDMAKACSTSSSNMETVIVLSVLTGVFFFLACCCCCKSLSQSNTISKLKARLAATKTVQEPKPIYSTNISTNNTDKEKLLA